MKKACCILPYFGKFNGYFQLWLNSCKINESITWFVITDDHTLYSTPPNVKFVYSDFDTIKRKAVLLFGSDIKLRTPYDLCLFRPAYHKLFNSFVEGFDYWGFCDCDLIFGDISADIAPIMEKGVDKISWRGHFTLFRNSSEINELYAVELEGNTTFKNAISIKPEKTLNLFDEVGINRIFDALGKSIYKGLLFANLKVSPANFICSHFSESEQYKNRNQIFEWDKGHLYRHYVYEGAIHTEEFYYIHFLRRHMDNMLNEDEYDHFLIIPNKFIPFEKISVEKVLRWSRPRFYYEYYYHRLKFHYLLKIIKRFFSKEGHLLPDVYECTIR